MCAPASGAKGRERASERASEKKKKKGFSLGNVVIIGWLYEFIIIAIFLDALFRCYLLVTIIEWKNGS